MKNIAKMTCLALVTTLGACSGTGYANRSLESVHQPVVRNAIYAFDVMTDGGDLPPSEQARLQGWFDAMQIRYGDRISIEDPSQYGNSAAARTINAMIAREGLLTSSAVPVTSGTIAPGGLRVIVTRASASVPGCPDWSSRYATNVNNSTSANYGCATNSNLAAMVADPNDLIKGATNEGNDPSAGTKPIRTYRDKAPSGAGGLKGTSTQGGGR
jgi:pilus assembly protein CpaD